MPTLHVIAPRQLLLTVVSTSSYAFACRSHSAALRMSANRMHPLLLLYAKMLQCWGWNSADVMTCTAQHSYRCTTTAQIVSGNSRRTSAVTLV